MIESRYFSQYQGNVKCTCIAYLKWRNYSLTHRIFLGKEKENRLLAVNSTMSGLIQEKTLAFALSIIAYEAVLTERRKYAVARQLIRCGTSVGANVREAQHAESRADFIHKLKIASKEAAETAYFLELCKRSPDYPDPGNMLENIMEIQRILTRIITSSKQKLTSRKA